ncbi:NAD(P)H nitroreductase [Pasteurellaceae bacterium LIM206]|nr:NAD(P)H nitroreductase [Pasteurellaceae bacterium LIM206]
MDTLTLLTSRRSNKKLVAPAPNKEQLRQIFQAALHAPDHGKLQPYRFFVIEGEGLPKFGQLLEQANQEFQLDEKSVKKAAGLAQESPMVIAVVAKIDPHIEKVPTWEQLAAASCAVYAMQLAANAQGFDNVWLSSKWVNGSALRHALGCGEHDQIIAFLKIGTAESKNEREPKTFNPDNLVSYL